MTYPADLADYLDAAVKEHARLTVLNAKAEEVGGSEALRMQKATVYGVLVGAGKALGLTVAQVLSRQYSAQQQG